MGRPPMVATTIDDSLEKSIVGLVAHMPEAFNRFAALGLQSADFGRAPHAYLWSAAAELDERRCAITPADLNRQLHEDGRAADCSPAYVYSLTEHVLWPRDEQQRGDLVRHQAKRLRELAVLRHAGYRLGEIQQELQQPGRTIDEIEAGIAALHARFARTIADDPGTPDVVWRDVQLQAQQHAGSGGAVLGLTSIDDNLGGIAPGRVCTILARSKVGKTFILCRAAFETLALGWGVVFFSLEMPRADVFSRLYRMASGLDRYQFLEALRTNQLDWNLWSSAFRRLLIFDQAHSPREQERLIRQAQHDTLRDVPGILVCTDYLGLISGNERLSAYERMSALARGRKQLAKRRRVALLDAGQVSRDAGGDGSQLLTLGAARDSGAIEEGSDFVVGFRRFDLSQLYPDQVRHDYRSTLFGSVLKNRHDEEPGREFAYRLDYRGLVFHEEKNLLPPELTRSAANALGRRR